MAQLEADIDTEAAKIIADEPYAPLGPVGIDPGGADPPQSTIQQGQLIDATGGDPSGREETVLDGTADVSEAAAGMLPSGLPAGSGMWSGSGSTSFVDTPVGRVLAPGGVIGSPAGDADALPRSERLSTTTNTGMVPVLPPMTANQQSAEALAGSTSIRRTRPGRNSFFRVPAALPAVITPPEEPGSHDPGPGVIGIDR
jgi:hypothetical protein